MSSRPHSVGVNLTPATKTTLFVVPTRMIAKWNLLYAYNGTASAKNYTAWWYDKSENVEIPVVYNYPLAASAYLKLDGGTYVVLDEGDEIRVQIESGAANATTIVTLEIEQRSTVQNFL
jgi:hypothetical protein